MLNASYDFRRNPKELLMGPESANAGWKNLGKGLQVVGGILSWKSAKDRADKLNKAQEDYYDALNTYLQNKNSDVGMTTNNFEDKVEDEELYKSLPDLEENSSERLYNTDEANNKRKQYRDIMDAFLQMYGGK